MNRKIRFQTTKQIDEETLQIKTISDYKRLDHPTDTVQILHDGMLIGTLRSLKNDPVHYVQVYIACTDAGRNVRVNGYLDYFPMADSGHPVYYLSWPLPDNFSIDL